jgi:hypothetical protein
MSESKSPLGAVMETIKDAASSFSRSRDSKTDVPENAEMHVDLHDDLHGSPIHASASDNPRRGPNAVDPDILEADVIEGKATTRRSIGERFTNLSKPQKIFVFVLVVAGAMVIKNQVETFPGVPGSDTPAPSHAIAVTPAAEVSQNELPAMSPDDKLGLPESGFGKSQATSPSEDAGNSTAKAIGFDTSGDLDLGAPATADASNVANANNEAPAFSLNGPFGDGALKSDAQLSLETQAQNQPPAGLKQGPEQPTPALNPSTVNNAHSIQSALTITDPEQIKAAEKPTNGASVNQAPQPTEQGNPFGKADEGVAKAPIGFDTRFGGEAVSKPDSGKPVLGNTEVNAEEAKLKSDLEAKNRTITDLEGKLKQANADLAAAKKQQPTLNHSRPDKKPARQQIAKSSTPSHKVAQTKPAKLLPRPQLCVGAVAEPARNCSTCVAHAFITNRGQSTMVGQGDYIDGYRVSIQGDRLDLQDDKGNVAHKFWSSPDGCRSI